MSPCAGRSVVLNLFHHCLVLLAFLLFVPCFSLFRAFLEFPRMPVLVLVIPCAQPCPGLKLAQKKAPAPLDHSQLLNW